MTSATPIYRKDIDGLRAIAVSAVVLFHAFPNALPGGFAGVDVFFVISGFLISTILFTKLENGTFSYFDFYWRRIKRIFPALLLMMFATYIAALFFLLPDELRALSKHLSAGAIFTSNFRLWDEAGYFDVSSDKKPLLHLWSLAIEEQFYIVWPVLLGFSFKRNWSFLKTCLAMLTVSLIFSLTIQKNYPHMNFYSPMSRFWEIAIGAIIAYVMMKRKSSSTTTLHHLSSVCGLALIIFSILYLDKGKVFPGAWALVPTLGACLLIFAGSHGFINRHFLTLKPMMWIGLISYPLYLWHWPLLSIAHISRPDIPELPQTIVCALIALSIILAYLTYRFLEFPIRHTSYSKKTMTILCSLMVIVWGLEGITYHFDGFVNRIPETVRKYVDIDFNWNAKVRYEKCFLQKDLVASFAPECAPSRSKFFIWGDSHAAALYPGFKNLQDKNQITIAQLTKANCPPLVTYHDNEQSHCANANELALREIVKSKPEVLILHGRWIYKGYADEEKILELIRATVSKVKKALPNTEIWIIGPVPTWRDSLSKLVIRDYIQNKRTAIPTYMKYGLEPRIIEVDEFLKEGLKNSAAVYKSALEILCNNEGCLTSVGPDPLDLIDADYTHLSEAGSIFLINHLIEQQSIKNQINESYHMKDPVQDPS